MAISVVPDPLTFTGNASTSTYYPLTASTMPYVSTSDLTVEQIDATGAVTELVLNTDYTIGASGILTTTAVPVTESLRVRINAPATQTRTFLNNGKLDTDALVAALDAQALATQSVRRLARMGMRLAETAQDEETGITVPDDATRASKWGKFDAAGAYDPQTTAQMAAAVSAELALNASVSDKVTNTTADDASRALLAPAFTGQLLIQLDEATLWRGTGTTAGDWSFLGVAYQVFADATARDAAVPVYVGQMAQMTRGGSWYRAYGTSAGNWDWVSFGTFTPATETVWRVATSYAVGDLVKVPAWSVAGAGGLQAGSGANTAILNAAETWADNDLNGCVIELTSGATSGTRRRIIDYDLGTTTATVDTWTAPAAAVTYNLLRNSGFVIYECLVAHTSHASAFTVDLNDGNWKPYIVEDYHYHQRGRGGVVTPDEAWMMDADRADDWSGILDEVYQLFPATGSGGAAEAWGAQFKVQGTVHFETGQYDFGSEIKWVPRCTLTGPETPLSQASTVVRLRAEGCSVVSNGANDYQCIKTHIADADGDPDTSIGVGTDEGAGDNEPGVGTDTATYWRQIDDWLATTVYSEGDIVTRNGSYYRCMYGHTAAANAFEPPRDGTAILAQNSGSLISGVLYEFRATTSGTEDFSNRGAGAAPYAAGFTFTATSSGAPTSWGTANATLIKAGATWYKYWQKTVSQTAAAWADETFYTSGWDVAMDEYLVKGMDFGTDGTAHSVFFAGLRYMYLDCYSTVRTGVRAHLSQGGEMAFLDVDNFSRAGYRVANGGDSFRIKSCSVMRTGTNHPCHYGWWFDNGVIALTITNPTIQRAEVAMSFGTVAGIAVQGLETENVGLPIEFRYSTSLQYNYAASTGSTAGEAQGCFFSGCMLARQSDDTIVISSDIVAKVRYNLGSSKKPIGLHLSGYSTDASTNEQPYDSLQVQRNTAAGLRTFPLDPQYGYNNSGWDEFAFDFNLAKMLQNLRFCSIYTTTDTGPEGTPIIRLIAEDNPANQTGNATVQVDLLPGLWRIEIPASNTYGTGYDVSVLQTPSGTAVPGLSAYSTAGTKLERWWWHPGGQMEIVVASGAGDDASIDVYFRPWMETTRGAEDIVSAAYPAA